MSVLFLINRPSFSTRHLPLPCVRYAGLWTAFLSPLSSPPRVWTRCRSKTWNRDSMNASGCSRREAGWHFLVNRRCGAWSIGRTRCSRRRRGRLCADFRSSPVVGDCLKQRRSSSMGRYVRFTSSIWCPPWSGRVSCSSSREQELPDTACSRPSATTRPSTQWSRGEFSGAALAHPKVYSALADRAAAQMRGPEASEGFERLDDELDNLRAAAAISSASRTPAPPHSA